jgi:hypothetical protein
MGFIAAATAGFCVWIAVWAVGAKSFDSFMITILILILASGARIVASYLPGKRDN